MRVYVCQSVQSFYSNPRISVYLSLLTSINPFCVNTRHELHREKRGLKVDDDTKDMMKQVEREITVTKACRCPIPTLISIDNCFAYLVPFLLWFLAFHTSSCVTPCLNSNCVLFMFVNYDSLDCTAICKQRGIAS